MESWKNKDGKIITTERTRQKRVTVRLTMDEYFALESLANTAGLSQQEYIRKSIFEQEIVAVDGIKELVPELKRVGNNLNQIAKALNSGGYYHSGIMENQKELAEIWQLLRQYLQKQG